MEDVQSVKQCHGSMQDEGDIKSSLSKAAIDAAAATGKSVLSIDPHNAVSTITARRAAVECAMTSTDINLTDREALEKDETRYVNENSSRNAISHAHHGRSFRSAAATHCHGDQRFCFRESS